MRTLRRLLPVAALAAVLALSGCSDDETPADATPTTDAVSSGSGSWIEVPRVEEIQAAVESGAEVIDVRTPGEFSAGHLEGARNIDFNAPDFAEQVAKLDPETSYVLYCASGNRAGQAQQLMLEQGFTDVMNAGGYETLAAAGFATNS
ncbi:rhodanese-like domain-containing protein [Nocardioides ferulae]|uniref:rhodanese-like domain-containing protein n=1 Tax=Nocardioides ferulae TaxID=2340821 RepID=UPI000EB13C95|nr:rhodanese-like domain-containing protein [Nocardioides ferulae]